MICSLMNFSWGLRRALHRLRRRSELRLVLLGATVPAVGAIAIKAATRSSIVNPDRLVLGLYFSVVCVSSLMTCVMTHGACGRWRFAVRFRSAGESPASRAARMA